MIPVCTPTLTGKEWEYVKECFDTNWISSNGKFIKQFEEGFAKYCGCKYGIATTNGTNALHLAIASLGLGKGDEVIMPTFTMISSAKAIIYTGAKPVLVDADPDTWTMNPALIEEKITDKTKAIMTVPIYGHPCDMDAIMKIAQDHNLKIIEDGAEAIGAEYKGKRIGSFGEATCFSFYGNKIITTGEGGMVTTNNEAFAKKAQLLRNISFTEPRFHHHELGFNYRMTNVQAAIGVAQLEEVDKFVNARRKNAKLYNDLLADVPGLKLPIEHEDVKNVYWMYGILLEDEFGVTKDEAMKLLKEKGVETRSFFLPMNQQPLFKDKQDECFPEISGSYPVAEKLYKQGLYLPSASSLTEEEIRQVVDVVKSLKQ